MNTIYESAVIQYEDVPCGGATDQLWRATHLVVVPNVEEGDLFLIHADHQYKNDNSFWVELVNFISIDESITGIEEDAPGTSGLGEIAKSSIMGQNFHHDYGHYLVVNRDYIWRAPQGYDQLVFALRARARTSQGGGPYEVNAIYPNSPPQGQLQVLQIRE